MYKITRIDLNKISSIKIILFLFIKPSLVLTNNNKKSSIAMYYLKKIYMPKTKYCETNEVFNINWFL